MDLELARIGDLNPGTLVRGERKLAGDSAPTQWGLLARHGNGGNNYESGIVWIEQPTKESPCEFEKVADQNVLTANLKPCLWLDLSETALCDGGAHYGKPDRSGLILLRSGLFWFGAEYHSDSGVENGFLCTMEGDLTYVRQDATLSPCYSLGSWIIDQAEELSIMQLDPLRSR